MHLATGLSFEVVRSTAAGRREMPDWPALDVGERASEVFAAVVLGLLALMPAIVLVQLTDCDVGLIVGDLGCLAVVAVGLLVGLPLWVPAFGAVGLFGSPWLAIRWDLHVRALVATWAGAIRVSLALIGLLLAGALVAGALSAVPFLGSLVAIVVDVYTWLVGAHLIGGLVGRREEDLAAIYCR